jgi:hypothetical protein
MSCCIFECSAKVELKLNRDEGENFELEHGKRIGCFSG